MVAVGITALGLIVGSACAHAEHHLGNPAPGERAAQHDADARAERHCRIERKWDTAGGYRDERRCERHANGARGPQYGDPAAERGIVLYPAR